MFYVCSYPLEAGAIIRPGNWGRIVKTYTVRFGGPWILIRELIFEDVRKVQFPDRPSRFESIFLCERLDEILEFRRSSGRNLDLIYEVAIVDEGVAKHRGCMELTAIRDDDNFWSLKEKAQRYWSGQNIVKPEIVTKSQIRIIKEHAA